MKGKNLSKSLVGINFGMVIGFISNILANDGGISFPMYMLIYLTMLIPSIVLSVLICERIDGKKSEEG